MWNKSLTDSYGLHRGRGGLAWFDEFGTAEALGEIPKRNWATRVAKSSAQSETLESRENQTSTIFIWPLSGQLWTWALSCMCNSNDVCFHDRCGSYRRSWCKRRESVLIGCDACLINSYQNLFDNDNKWQQMQANACATTSFARKKNEI